LSHISKEVKIWAFANSSTRTKGKEARLTMPQKLCKTISLINDHISLVYYHRSFAYNFYLKKILPFKISVCSRDYTGVL